MAKSKAKMPDGLRELAVAAGEEHITRPCAPRVLIQKAGKSWRFASPYPDEDQEHWEALLFQAFGTRSSAVMNHFMDVFTGLVGEGEWDDKRKFWMPNQGEFDALLAMIHAFTPQNEAQAAYAAQLCALHLSAMRLGKASSRSYSDDRTAAIFAKTVRAFGDGMERMARLQGKIQPRQVNQTIEVHYHDHRDQRSVHFTGGGADNRGQAHGTTGATTIQRPALPCPRPDGETLSSASGEGQASVPRPWWGQRLWRSVRPA